MAGIIDKRIIQSPHLEPLQHWYYNRGIESLRVLNI